MTLQPAAQAQRPIVLLFGQLQGKQGLLRYQIQLKKICKNINITISGFRLKFQNIFIILKK
jgi:hypothetical protein